MKFVEFQANSRISRLLASFGEVIYDTERCNRFVTDLLGFFRHKRGRTAVLTLHWGVVL